ncbi:MAG TPA: hypothetical protein VIJ85_10130 [Rhizomicrobium sp.]
MTDAPRRPESATLRNTLVAATVIGVLLLMLSVFPLMMSPMIFDSGESADTWSIFIAIWLAPVVLIAGLVIGWIGFASGARRVAIAGLVVAAVPAVLALGVLIMAGV